MCCKMTYFAQIVLAACGALALGLVYSLPADETDAQAKPADAKAKDQPGKPDASGLVKLTKEHDVWLDLKRKAVVVDGEVCLREGQLEMFACPKGTLMANAGRPALPPHLQPPPARPAGGKLAGQRILDVRRLPRPHPPPRHQGPPRPHPAAEKRRGCEGRNEARRDETELRENH